MTINIEKENILQDLPNFNEIFRKYGNNLIIILKVTKCRAVPFL